MMGITHFLIILLKELRNSVMKSFLIQSSYDN